MTLPEVIFTICCRTTASPYHIFESLFELGTVHFYEIGGAGGIWGGTCEKKMAIGGGGGHLKNIREKGGSEEMF